MFGQRDRTVKWFNYLKWCEEALWEASGHSGQPQWQETQMVCTQHIKTVWPACLALQQVGLKVRGGGNQL